MGSSIIIDDIVKFMKQVPPFQFLDDGRLRSIAGSMSVEFYPRGMEILSQDDPVNEYFRIIKKGGVRVSVRGEGKEQIELDQRGEGDTFGLVSLIGKDRQKTTVTAMEDTICYLLDRRTVMKLIDTTPAFTEYFLQSHFEKYIDHTYREMHSKSLFYGSSDHLLFTTHVGEIATKDVVTAGSDIAIRDAAKLMVEHRISSLVVVDAHGLPAGIVTDRDLREKVVARGRDVDHPVREIMTLPLVRVDARDYCFEAVLKMIKHKIHHILVIRDGVLSGVLTNHDLMVLQGTSPLSFAKDLESQESIEGLVPVSTKINRVVGLLLKEGARGSNITKIITELNDRLVSKVLEFAERKYGKPPVPYCWICFGSEGRKEQTFKTDQDNALIYADPGTPEMEEKARTYFEQFAVFVREGLVRCGFPPCEADYMASNPKWRQPLSVWKQYFTRWITSPTPEAVLRSLIFFDFRPMSHDCGLADELRRHLQESLTGKNLFFAQVASAALKNRTPVGFFKTFVVEKGGEHKNELNLKLHGISLLVDIVRLLALETGIPQTSTLERIEAMKGKHPAIDELGDDLAQAFEFITLLRIHHQVEQMDAARLPDNFINPSSLSNLEKRTLRESFRVIDKMQDNLADLYGPGLVTG